MVELSKEDLDFLRKVRVYEKDSKGSSGFQLKPIPSTTDYDLYQKTCHIVNRLVNSGLLKITYQTTDSLSWRHATPHEIAEWKTSGKQYDLFSYVEISKSSQV